MSLTRALAQRVKNWFGRILPSRPFRRYDPQRRPLAIELLEDRNLLSVSASVAGSEVTFSASNDLYLRIANGQLQVSETGVGAFSSDLNLSAPGSPTYSVSSEWPITRSHLG